MCLIIASPTGEVPTCGVIERGWNDNPHGWGLMQSDGSELIVNKGMKFNELQPLLEKAKGNPYVLHYRFATHGTKNLDNCHPFRVTKRLYMAHNGIIAIEQKNKLMSDTWHYAQELRQLGIDHDNVSDEEIISMLGTWVGNYNKLAFLADSGNITLVNEKSGTWKDGIWYSNTHSFYEQVEYTRYSRYYSHHYQQRQASWDWDKYNEPDQAWARGWDIPTQNSGKMTKGDIITAQDLKTWEDGSDIWAHCEYCNELDWLDIVPECDDMTLCVPCRKVLTPLFQTDQPEGLNAGVFYDSNGVPYSWDDVDESIAVVRQAYEGRS